MGVGIPHVIVIQRHQLLPSRHPNWAENNHFGDYLGPNKQCRWVHNTAEAFQSQNWLIRNCYKVWNGIHTEVCNPNTPLSAKLVPKLSNFGAKNEQLCDYSGQNNLWACLQFAAIFFKVKIKWLPRLTQHGRIITHVFVIQIHHLRYRQYPIEA